MTQAQNLCRTDILHGGKVSDHNLVQSYLTYDFCKLLLYTDLDLIHGIIGEEHQRILIKIISVEKDVNNPNEYVVTGKSNLKDKVQSFSGTLRILKIQELRAFTFGIDDEYKEKVRSRFLLTAEYVFNESNEHHNSGVYKGIFTSRFYTDKNQQVKYDNIDIETDSYFNNSFVGTWTSYKGTTKICNWGDYRVPSSYCDFDIGVAEFNVSDKYIKNGWWIKPKYMWWQ